MSFGTRLHNNGKMSSYDTGCIVNTEIGQSLHNPGLVKNPVV